MRFVLTMSGRGVITLPAKLRKEYALEPEGQIIAESTPEGILLKPAVTYPIEIYSDERIKEFEESERELEGAMKKKSLL